ncbi:TPR-like protein [Gloeophyllum trabeum ATCC 11539]|uniref:TPR-like protein n=1 Tax=Gloeophyllum trabeum (strain ATCC 11539 / FP-39264 / Madison 617) TaxID=670483 RepID=S7RN03_GLOTA|nr:TPR-like protein [Gloeophyllum trabeum ATCC 11539]EPQ54099.1 TPR-like protein [Gloeophyllum trabeum ATCC 11539]
MAPRRAHEGPSKGEKALDALQKTLDVTSTVADATNTPFVKGGLQMAIKIVEAAQLTKKNQHNCEEVAQRAAHIMLNVAETLKGKNAGDINRELQSQLGMFQSKLSDICCDMEQMKSRRWLKRFLAGKSDSDAISRWNQYLSDTRQLFMESGLIDLQIGLAKIGSDITYVRTTLDVLTGSAQNCDSCSECDQLQNTPNLFLSRTPPPMPSAFHGREREVSEAVQMILSSWSQPQSNLAILGPGGMGKTSLALAVLHHQDIKDAFGEQIYFVPCDSAASADLLVSHIITVFPIYKGDGEDILTSLDIFLRGVPRLLLALDNFETPYQEGNSQGVGEVLRRIVAVPQVTVMITMRGDFAPVEALWCQLLKLEPLSMAASKKIFFHFNQKCEDIQALDSLLDGLDRIPLAVTLVSHLAQSESVESLIVQWEEMKTSLLQHGAADEKNNNLEVSIDLSLKSKIIQKATSAIDLLALISYLPDGILALSKQQQQQSLQDMVSHMEGRYEGLKALKAVGLVQESGGSINTLSPIRHYVLKKYPLHQIHREALEKYYITLISKYDPKNPNGIDSHLMSESGNIIALVKQATQRQGGLSSELLHAAYEMSWFLFHHKPTTELLDLIIPMSMSLDDRVFQADCQRLAGLILRFTYNYTKAQVQAYAAMNRLNTLRLEKLQKAREEFQQVGDRYGQAQCLQSIGDILWMQDEYPEAVEKLQEAREEFQQIGDRSGQVQCLQTLGDILWVQGEYSEAVERLQQAKGQFQQIGDSLGQAQCLRSLGNIMWMQSEYCEAVEKLQQAKEQFQQIGDRLGQAQCLQSLGDILKMQEEYPVAVEKLQQAREQFQQVGDRLGQAQCLRSLGDILWMQGGYPESVKMLEQARAEFRQIGDKLALAQCLMCLGVVLESQQKWSEAVEKLQEARKLFKLVGDRRGQARCLQSLDDILKMQYEN